MLIVGRDLTETLDVSGLVNLGILICYGNQLTALDVSDCTALKFLRCQDNQLMTLDVSGCTTLRYLECSDNKLTSLDVPGNTVLEEIYCSRNENLVSLDASGCTSLQRLWCDNNQLTSLDVSGCTALLEMYCNDNKLTSLNVSGCTALTDMWCYANELTELDVSGCTALQRLDCGSWNGELQQIRGNNLTSLNVSKNPSLRELYCAGNLLTSLNISGCTALGTLYCYSNELTELDVSDCTTLSWLFCWDNPLQFSTLTLPSQKLYFAGDGEFQKVSITMPIPAMIANDGTLDLSNEYLIEDNETQYVWYYVDNDSEVDSSLYTEIGGKFTFTGLNNGDVIYCEMTNVRFIDYIGEIEEETGLPWQVGMTLKTTHITVGSPSSDPTYVLNVPSGTTDQALRKHTNFKKGTASTGGTIPQSTVGSVKTVSAKKGGATTQTSIELNWKAVNQNQLSRYDNVTEILIQVQTGSGKNIRTVAGFVVNVAQAGTSVGYTTTDANGVHVHVPPVLAVFAHTAPCLPSCCGSWVLPDSPTEGRQWAVLQT